MFVRILRTSSFIERKKWLLEIYSEDGPVHSDGLTIELMTKQFLYKFKSENLLKEELKITDSLQLNLSLRHFHALSWESLCIFCEKWKLKILLSFCAFVIWYKIFIYFYYHNYIFHYYYMFFK